MAWVKKSVSYAFANSGDPNKITVSWCKKDDAVIGAQKEGKFEYTLDGAKTWTVNKADIQAKVDSDTGVIPA